MEQRRRRRASGSTSGPSREPRIHTHIHRRVYTHTHVHIHIHSRTLTLTHRSRFLGRGAAPSRVASDWRLGLRSKAAAKSQREGRALDSLLCFWTVWSALAAKRATSGKSRLVGWPETAPTVVVAAARREKRERIRPEIDQGTYLPRTGIECQEGHGQR